MLTVALAVAAPPAWAVAAWLAQPDLTASGDNASVPDVAMNAGGDAVVAWQRSSGTDLFAQASLRDAGTNFSSPVPLGPAGLSALGTPQAAIDGAGNAIVVWQQPDGFTLNTIVQAAVRPAGGSFGAPVTLSATGSVSVHPQIAMNAAGDAIVAWEHLANQEVVIQAAVRPAGGSFAAPVDVSAAGPQGEPPGVALDSAGTATVVWTQTSAAGATAQSATRPAGGAFAAPVDLSATGQVSSPQVATNGAGETVAVWERVDTNTRFVQAAIRPAGGAFSAPADLSIFGGDAIAPQVAIDADGNAVAVWARFDGTTRVVQIATRPRDGTFGLPGALSPAGGEARAPQVAVSPGGDIVVAWQRSDGANTIVQAVARRAGAGFGATADLSAPGQDAIEPQVGIDADGDAVAAWQRSDGMNTIVQGAGHDAAGPQLRGLSVPATATTGTAATYSVSPLDVWSPVSSTQWSFDDGTTAPGAGVSHAFAAAGDHAVTVTATDALGNTTTATRLVAVAAPAPGDPATQAVLPPPPPPPPCTTCAVKLPKLNVAIGFDAHVTKRYTAFTKLVVQPAVAGTTIHVRCTGPGCRFKTKSRTVTKPARRLDLTSLVRGARLRRGAQIAVRVTKPDTVGASATIGVRDRKRPRRVVRCLFPGDPVPAPCPA
jgi:PKD repeat protein